MKLYELFNSNLLEAEEEAMQHFIINKYELGQLTYEQAWAEIQKITPEDELFFWQMEIDACRDYLEEPISPAINPNHHRAPSSVN